MSIPRQLVNLRTNMLRRCYDEQHKSFKYVGGRGVVVCDDWKASAHVFYDWCLTNGWDVGLYLDRIDNDSNYCPDNCRFITPSASARNRRSNVFITAWGETKLQIDWLQDPRCTVSAQVLKRELSRGVASEIAMSTHAPKGKPSPAIKAWGESKRLSEWLTDARCNANRFQITSRLRAGVKAEEAISFGSGFRICNDRGYTYLRRIPASSVRSTKSVNIGVRSGGRND